MNTALSPSEIAKHFLAASRPQALRNGETESSTKELSASARYIVRETKKLLGQYSCPAEGRVPQHEEELLSLIQGIEEREGEELSERERLAVLEALLSSREHYDLLTPLIENPEVNDIIIRSFDDISVQTSRRNIQTDLSFPDAESYRAFLERLLKRAGKSCTLGSPIVDASPDPRVRVCATHESLSPEGSGPFLTIRVARHESISLDALYHYRMAPRCLLEYLAGVVTSGHHSLLIAGEVGTGKTTLVRALAQRIPEEEALLIIEDTHEIVLNRPFVRTLLTKPANAEGAGRISPAIAIRAGMRMAMNRLLLGEMRDAEAAEAFIDVCASGHAGISTIHARSARDAIGRLELFLSRAQGAVHMDTIRRQIANAVSVVVFLGLCRDSQQRRVLEVAEIGSYADGAIQFSPLFRYHPERGTPLWRREGGFSSIALPTPGSILGFESPEGDR